jgi:hypothetical protein
MDGDHFQALKDRCQSCDVGNARLQGGACK